MIAELEKLRQKYPAYSGMDDATLVNALVRKYPVYKPLQEKVAAQRKTITERDVREAGAEEIRKADASAQPSILSEVVSPLMSGASTFSTGGLLKEGIGAIDPMWKALVFPEQKTLPGKVSRFASEALGLMEGVPGRLMVGGGQAVARGLAKKAPGAFVGDVATRRLIPTTLGMKALTYGAEGAIGGATYAPEDLDVKRLPEQVLIGAGLGTAAPLAGEALKGISSATRKGLQAGSEKIYHTIMGTLKNDFSYSKNPGRGLRKERMVFDDMHDAVQKIDDRLTQRTAEMENYVKDSTARVNAEDGVNQVLNKYAKTAAESGNDDMFNAVQRIRGMLYNEMAPGVNELGAPAIVTTGVRNLHDMTLSQALKLKRLIGDITHFPTNPSNISNVNKLKRELYGAVRSSMEKADSSIGEMNETIADLIGAKNSARHREVVDARKKLIGLTEIVSGSGAAMGSAFGHTPESILGALTMIGIKRASESPFVMTRLASLMETMSRADAIRFFNAAPYAVMQGLRSLGGKARQMVEEYEAMPNTFSGSIGIEERAGAVDADIINQGLPGPEGRPRLPAPEGKAYGEGFSMTEGRQENLPPLYEGAQRVENPSGGVQAGEEFKSGAQLQREAEAQAEIEKARIGMAQGEAPEMSSSKSVSPVEKAERLQKSRQAMEMQDAREGMVNPTGENVIFTKSEYQKAAERMGMKLRRIGANPIFDPEMYSDAVKIGGYHFEKGVRDFASWSRQMIAELGEAIRPHLQKIWKELQGHPLNFKTAEEYVASKGNPLYHGTRKVFDKFAENKEGIWVTTDKDIANRYVAGESKNPNGRIIEVFIDTKNLAPKKIYDAVLMQDRRVDDPIEELKVKGYDGIKYSDRAIIVFSPENIKTKSQLTAEWEKAHGGMLGNNRGSVRISGEDIPEHRRVGTTGRYVGAPQGTVSHQKLAALRKQYEASAVRGEPGKDWYRHNGEAILEMFQGDVKEAKKFAKLVAIFSPHTQVNPNFHNALKAYNQALIGEPIRGIATSEMNRRASELLYDGIDWSGIKTNSFYQNMLKYIDPKDADHNAVTIDLWMMRSMGYKNEKPSEQQYEFAKNEIRRIAKKKGWTPDQVQAAMWIDAKALHEGKPVSEMQLRGYKDSPEKIMGQLSWEAAPSKTSGLFPESFDAPWEDRMEYHAAVDQVFYDDKGTDLVAEMVGLTKPNKFEGVGVYKQQISPGSQFQIPMPQKTGGGEIDPATKKSLDLYAAIRGLYSSQDGVAYHRPFYNTTITESNGAEIFLKSPITSTEAKTLETQMVTHGVPDVAIVPTKNGVRVINFTSDLPNKKFHDILKNKIDIIFFNRPENPELWRFKSDGNLVTNDWTEASNGEMYRQRILAEKSPDFLRRCDDIFGGKMESVIRDFKERKGWTDSRGQAKPTEIAPEATQGDMVSLPEETSASPKMPSKVSKKKIDYLHDKFGEPVDKINYIDGRLMPVTVGKNHGDMLTKTQRRNDFWGMVRMFVDHDSKIIGTRSWGYRDEPGWSKEMDLAKQREAVMAFAKDNKGWKWIPNVDYFVGREERLRAENNPRLKKMAIKIPSEKVAGALGTTALGLASSAEASDDFSETKHKIAKVEHSGDLSGDWAQLTPTVFQDLRQLKRIDDSVTLKRARKDPKMYERVVKLYLKRMDDFGVPDDVKWLWWYKPALYRKTGGDVNKISDPKDRNIMKNRLKNVGR